MRLGGSRQIAAHARQLLRMLLARQLAPQLLEAQIDEPGVEDVRLAVAADGAEVAALPGVPHLAAVEAELAGKPQQTGHVGKRCAPAALKARQYVHEVRMPLVKAVEVVVVTKGGVLIARLPETRRLHTGKESAVGEHRQIESGAVPRHQVRGVLGEALEEALYQLPLRARQLAETPHPEGIAVAQRTGDRHHVLLLGRQEIATRDLPPQRVHRLRDLRIGESTEPVEPPAEVDVGYGLDIEYQRAHTALISTATATTRPRSSVSVTCPSPMPSERRTRSPRSENTTSGLPHAFCTTPTSRIHMPCAKPVPIALTIASLAAKRMARKRSGRAVSASCACSSGISRCSTKRVPKRSSVCVMRAASSTSTPMPKITRAPHSSASSSRALPLAVRPTAPAPRSHGRC